MKKGGNMTDLNSLVANYVTKNPNVNVNDVIDKLGNLDFDLYENFSNNRHESLFDFETGADSMNQDTFINLMATATGKNADDIKEEATLLFNILDSNDDDSKNSLTKDELSIFKSSEGVIDHFSVWNKILVDEEKINKKIDEANNADNSENNINTINNSTQINNEKDLMSEIDTDGNGKITQKELDEYNKKTNKSNDEKNANANNSDDDLFNQIDSDHNGIITKDEFNNYKHSSNNLFSKLDKNGDGKITQEEIDEYNGL